MSKLRLDKIISSSAFVSRREAAEMIRRGAVTVDGAVPASGAEKYDPAVSLILINGIPADYREHRYIMMNKPAGVLSATEDLRDRTVADLLREPYSKMGLFPEMCIRDSDQYPLIAETAVLYIANKPCHAFFRKEGFKASAGVYVIKSESDCI